MAAAPHQADLTRAIDDLRRTRAALLALLRPLTAEDFARTRPGAWTIGRVARHLAESDVLYARLLAHQTGNDPGALPDPTPRDGAEAAAMLEATSTAMLGMIEGIDAETLYRIVKVGREEYSPLSVLENVAMHDAEHLAQIRDLLDATARPAVVRSPAAPPLAARIRPATEADLAAINDIYNHYIRETAITFDIEPWTIEERRAWFAKFAPTGRHQLFVAEASAAVVGFACAGQFRTKAAYDTTVETTIYCAPDAAGRGIGRALYARLFESLRDQDVHACVAGITLPNEPSCALHESFGFRRIGVLREVGFKFGRYWDVAWYERPASDQAHRG